MNKLCAVSVACLLLGASPFAYSQNDPPDKKTAQSRTNKSGGQKQQQLTVDIPAGVNVTVSGKLDVSPQEAKTKDEGEKPNFWKSFFLEIKITDVLLVVFTGLLWWVTGGLRNSTDKLWRAADQQERDMATSLKIATANTEAAKEQARVAIKARLPVVGWAGAKLCEIRNFSHEHVEKGTDPFPPGMPPVISEPIVSITNAGPTNVGMHFFRARWGVWRLRDFPPEPFYEGKGRVGHFLRQDVTLPISAGEYITISKEEMKDIEDKERSLWLYGFAEYTDFLDEWHTLRFCYRWDLKSGFVPDGPEPYWKNDHQKTY